jgi:hypothetical protein
MTAPDLAALAQKWIAEARATYPATLSASGDAVMIDGGPFYAFYLRRDGAVLQADDDWGDELREVEDPDVRTLAFRAGSARRPELAAAIPAGVAGTVECSACRGSGWDHAGAASFVCQPCAGRGWRVSGR